ncbi:ABC transporter permease [Aquipuribacter sp. MA13-6]|uniref:ABC transporter permease n=1 Tax=unclassified Aquipuribacter TaxID=2635084 RepID=UPI003EF0561F
MNVRLHAVGVGVRRGLTEFVQSLRSPQDQGFYLFFGVATVIFLYVNRTNEVEGTDLLYPAVALPSILGALLVFNAMLGPAFALAMEREDGTLLRAKAVPNGMVGYVSGQAVYHSLGLLPMLLVVLVPSTILFDGVLPGGASAWLTFAWVVVLGLLATLPIGMIIGALVPSTQKVSTWGMLPILLLTGISGIFVPLQAMWGWLQVVAQVFPLYWIGLGLRSAFLPEAAAAIEITGTWRTWETVAVLSAWAALALALTPVVLRRMARRQSGSAVEAARQAAVQTIR